MRTIYVSPEFPLNCRMRKDVRRGKLQVIREGGERSSLGGGIPTVCARWIWAWPLPCCCAVPGNSEKPLCRVKSSRSYPRPPTSCRRSSTNTRLPAKSALHKSFWKTRFIFLIRGRLTIHLIVGLRLTFPLRKRKKSGLIAASRIWTAHASTKFANYSSRIPMCFVWFLWDPFIILFCERTRASVVFPRKGILCQCGRIMRDPTREYALKYPLFGSGMSLSPHLVWG